MNTNNKSLSFTPKVKISILIIAINNEVQTEVDDNWKNELDFSSIVFEETADSNSTENSQATNQEKIDMAWIDKKKIANKTVLEAKSSNINTIAPFGCGHCDANFSSFDSLKKHITGTYIYFLFKHFSILIFCFDNLRFYGSSSSEVIIDIIF